MTAALMTCDVCVIGAGPAGIAAAAVAAETGKRVIIVDEGAGPGGQIWRPGGAAPSAAARRWMRRLGSSGAAVWHSSGVVDLRSGAGGRTLALVETRDGVVTVDAAAVVVATGARELFLPFPGWTLPNVLGVGAAQAMLKGGLSFSGRRVVIAGSGPLLLAVAAALARAGADLRLIAEQAPRTRVARFVAGLWRTPGALLQAATYRAATVGTRYAMGSWVVSAEGGNALRSVMVTDGSSARRIDCDMLCVAFGLIPNDEIARRAGCETRAGRVVVDARQLTTVANVYCAGEPTGIGGVELAVVEGEIAGLAASGAAATATLVARRTRLRAYASALEDTFVLRREVTTLATPATIVCRCEDVRLGDVDPTWSSRQAKLYTRAGMGPCQGRICGPALQCMVGWDRDSIRAPTQPARVSTLSAATSSSQSSHAGA